MVVNIQAEILKLGEAFFVTLRPVVLRSPLFLINPSEGTVWTLGLTLFSLGAMHQWATPFVHLPGPPASHLYNGMLTATLQDYCEASGSL